MSIRYHLITLVAVFLALGIGVAVGSTVIDQALVDNLEARVDSLENGLGDARAENEQLRGQLDAFERVGAGLDVEGPASFLAGELSDVPVVVLAVDGVDPAPLEELRAAIGSAGGRYQATVWFTERLALSDDDAVRALADVLDGPAGDAPALRARLGDQLAARLAAAAAVPAVASGAAGAEAGGGDSGDDDGGGGADGAGAGEGFESATLTALLEQLDDAGFVRLSDRADSAERDLSGVRIVVVSGEGARLPHASLVDPLVDALAADGPALAVVAEGSTALVPTLDPPSTDAPVLAPRGTFIGRVRADSDLRERVSTVDDLEVFAGRAATVMAVSDLANGSVGHYGIGEGADALLPDS